MGGKVTSLVVDFVAAVVVGIADFVDFVVFFLYCCCCCNFLMLLLLLMVLSLSPLLL